MSLDLNPSLNAFGYNITCFGMHDGYINLTISNGVGPYTIEWSNGASTEDVTGLAAGYYTVRVRDQITNATGWAEITLIEPEPIFTSVQLFSSVYPNGYHVTCSSCTDASIATSVESGVSPFLFEWNDGATSQDRTSIHAGAYEVTVTGANGCAAKAQIILTAPEREDWTAFGNSGSNPGIHFLGTIDNKDLVLKTNSVERLRILNSGSIKFNSFIGTEDRLLKVDANGILGISAGSVPWYSRGNNSINSSLDFIGTLDNAPLIFKTDANGNGGERMRVNATGSVGIGTFNQIPLNNGSNNPCILGIAGWVAIGDAGFYGLPNLTNTNTSLLVQGSVGIGTNSIPSNIDFMINGTSEFNGSVGIGVDPTINNANTYKLVVGGKLGAEEAWVSLGNPWPDYVFSDQYKLKSFDELESFIIKNNHLPGLPSAHEMNKDEKMNLGAMQIKNLEKTEELFLYVIQLKKEIEALKKKISLFESQSNK